MELFDLVCNLTPADDRDAYRQPQQQYQRGPQEGVCESGSRRHFEEGDVMSVWVVEAGETLSDLGVAVLEFQHVVDVVLAIVGADIQRTLQGGQSES